MKATRWMFVLAAMSVVFAACAGAEPRSKPADLTQAEPLPPPPDYLLDHLNLLGKSAGVQILQISSTSPPAGGITISEDRPPAYLAVKANGGFYAMGKFIFLLETREPKAIIRSWEIRVAPTPAGMKDDSIPPTKELTVSLIYHGKQDGDLLSWMTLDNVWAIVDSVPLLWLTRIRFVEAEEAQILRRRIRENSGSESEAVAPYALELSLRMYGEDSSQAADVRDTLASNDYLKEHLPNVGLNPSPTVSIEDGVKVMSFDIIMVADADK